MSYARYCLLLSVLFGLALAIPDARAQVGMTVAVSLPPPGVAGTVVATCTADLYSADYYGPFDDDSYFYAGVYMQSCILYTPGNGEHSCFGGGNGGGYASSSCTIAAESTPSSGDYNLNAEIAVYNWYDSLALGTGEYGWDTCWESPFLWDDPLGYAVTGTASYPNANSAGPYTGYGLVWSCVNGDVFSDIMEIESPAYPWSGVISVSISPTAATLTQGGTQQFDATVTNASNKAVTWSISPAGAGSISTSGLYTAPAAVTAQQTLTVTATSQQDTNIFADAGVTLTVPSPTVVSISSSSWNAGTSFPLTITGTGFNSATQVTISSPSWAISSTCSDSNATTIVCSNPGVTIPANLAPVTASQGATITVCNGSNCYTYPVTGAISIAPITYTYTVTLAVPSSSLTYGYSTTITPTITCKTATSACGSNVSNPQGAYFALSGIGSLSPTGLQTSTTFTASTMIGYPTQSSVVHACAPLQTSSCTTATISTGGITIALSPPALSNPLTGGNTQNFSASVQNPGEATTNALTWTLSPSVGTLASTTSSISGSPTSGTSSNIYHAPSSINTLTTVALSACMTANANICATPVTITLWPPPTFTVAYTEMYPTSNLPANTVSMGHAIAYTVNVNSLYGFAGTVNLSASGLPAGITASFSSPSVAVPSNGSGSAIMLISAGYGAGSSPPPPSTVTITGTVGGGPSSSTGFTLTPRAMQYAGDCSVPSGSGSNLNAQSVYAALGWGNYPNMP